MTGDVRTTKHARVRWSERLSPKTWAQNPIEKAWREGDLVEAPAVRGDEVRLYELPDGERDMLLVGWETADGVEVRTALYADPDRMEPVEGAES